METKNFIKHYPQLVRLFSSSIELHIILDIMSYTSNNQQYYKTKKTISEEIGCDEKTVYNYIYKLVKQGYIIKETFSKFDGNKGGSKSFLTVNIDKIDEELEKRGITSEQPIIKKEVEQPKTYDTPAIVNEDFSTEEVIEEVTQPTDEVTIENWETDNKKLIIEFLFIGKQKQYELLKKLRLKYGYDSFDDDDYDSDDIHNLETQGYIRYIYSRKKYVVTEKYNDDIKKMMIERGIEVKEEVKEELNQEQLNWLNQPKENNFSIEDDDDEDYGYNPDWKETKESPDELKKLLKITE